MKKLTILIIAVMMMSINTATSQTRERSTIPVQYTWDLTPIYPSDEVWQVSKSAFVSRLDEILKYQGKIGASAENLYDCLNMRSKMTKELVRLYVYANLKSDLDTRDSKVMAMKQEMGQIATNFGSKCSFIDPEILKIVPKIINEFFAKKKDLKIFRFYINDLQRSQKHMLSEGEEKIIAEAGLMSDTPYSIFGIFANADFPYPDLVLSNGEKIHLNQASFGKYRTLENRQDREAVFQTFFGRLYDYRRTFGTQLDANVKKDMFYARVRGYNSCLESALDKGNIPVEVYKTLIRNVNNNLDTFYRYLNLKKKMLGVEQLKYSDLYAPVVKGNDAEYSIDDAKGMILSALRPLGNEYISTVNHAFNERWLDMYPTPGKRSGAYSNGSAYDVHPYMLLNFNGMYQDVSTMAHELGHTMHSYFSNKNQPYPTSDYSIFVAEVASTFNEITLFHNYLNTVKDDNMRLSLLMEYLDGIKSTVFRQTQFAEFELRIHEMAESGEQLTGDSMTELYKQIVRAYYGHDKGICYVDDFINIEWAYIPHFYYNFYVYQYSTSWTAATALSEKVRNGEKGALEKYLTLLSSGGSDYPINLLKKVGVDMTTSEPFNQTMKEMNWVMDEIEKILAKQNK
ncbi:MAG: oligoendopeptidase F [Candidatus Marinimicrobia bacterium CG08_land_8_20_14_0_20_45_22]|nr:MAG: oligoendopeptidase F [Candidatus Marinimicrobia bacterium CG08_land_8_20_14_0_20_45_22]